MISPSEGEWHEAGNFTPENPPPVPCAFNAFGQYVPIERPWWG